MVSASLLALFPAAALVASAALPVTDPYWDGRVPQDFTPADFDSWAKSPFNNEWNKGENQLWADIISFPEDVPTSLFDAPDRKALELVIKLALPQAIELRQVLTSIQRRVRVRSRWQRTERLPSL